MKTFKFVLCLIIILTLSACAKVDITKTAEGFFEPTNPSTVKILKTEPQESFIELGTVIVSGFQSTDTAKMHNAIRTKSAPLGADAVILTDQGLIPLGFGNYEMWATGVAIKFNN